MSGPKSLTIVVAALLAAFLASAIALWLQPRSASARDYLLNPRKLDGTWLVQQAQLNRLTQVDQAWTSKFTIEGGKFTMSHFCGSSLDLKGTFRLESAVAPNAVDLNVNAIDLSEGVQYPNCTLPGIYEVHDNSLTLCFRTSSKLKRPSDFSSNDNDTIVLSLVRADAGFKDFPKTVTITVTDSAGNAAGGASVFQNMWLFRDAKKKDAAFNWKYMEIVKTNATGAAHVAYDALRDATVNVRDGERKLMAVQSISPASLQRGMVEVRLQPECLVTGRMTCNELAQVGKPIQWTNAYLLFGGQRIGECHAKPGEFEFHVPPGRYTVDVYGEDLKGKYLDFTVPAGRSVFQLPPISMIASNLVRLRGKPAPELDGVVGWRGGPVKLADLKGKYVLLDFWGYWCGPCVGAMPTLIELHERLKDKGLVIIGVHCDMDGEINTTAKVEEKIALLKEKVWKGKDLPFPIALTTKSSSYNEQQYDGTAAAQYGVLGYPTTILIDKDGNVVGEFAARDTKKAIADVEELLAPKR